MSDALAMLQEIERLRNAVIQARRDLWWFIERDTGELWGFTENDVGEIAARAMAIQDDVLGAALAGAPGESVSENGDFQ